MVADPQLHVKIDWEHDGTFAGTYDDVSGDVDGEPGVTADTGMDQGRPLRPPMIGVSDFELINDDGLYSHENASSPLYQLVRPGTPVQITSSVGAQQTYRAHVTYRSNTPYRGRAVHIFHRGVMSEISQRGQWGDRRVAITSLSVTSKLRGRIISTPIYQNIRTDEALTHILDAVDWPPGSRALSAGDTTMLYWWADEVDAWEAALHVLRTEGPGALYEDEDGWFHFENRNYRATASRSTTSQESFADTDQPGKRWYVDLKYEPNWQNIVNHATYRTQRRNTTVTGTKVWEYGEDLVLGAAPSTKTITVRFDEPSIDLFSPESGTDYAVSGGTISAEISAFSGATVQLTLHSESGTPTVTGVTSEGIQIRGTPLTPIGEQVATNTVDASESVTRYDTRSADMGGWPELTEASAEAVCNAVVTRRKDQLPQLFMTLRNVDDDHLNAMFGAQVSDRVTIENASFGLATEAWVERRSYALRGFNASEAICELGLEAAVALAGGDLWDEGIWDTAVWSD